MITIQNRAGDTTHTSKNLRGLQAHLRRETVMEIHIRRLATGGGRLSVLFDNGDSCAVDFADYGILCGWVIGRRALHGVTLWVSGQQSGTVNKRHTHLAAMAR